jgi:hypothetical protein
LCEAERDEVRRLARRSGRKGLRDGQASEAGGGEESIQAVPVAGLGGKTRHGGADEIRQTLRLLRVACRDVATDHVFRSRVEDSGSFTRLRVVAADALQHEATGGCGIGGVAASGFFQHGCKAFGHGAVGPQEVGERDGVGAGVAAQNARVEAGLIAKGGVEAGWVVMPSASVTSAMLVGVLGSVPAAGRLVACVYAVGLVAIWFGPETRGNRCGTIDPYSDASLVSLYQSLSASSVPLRLRDRIERSLRDMIEHQADRREVEHGFRR